MLVHFMSSWNILRLFGIFYDHLVYFPRFDLFYKEKSGNPGIKFTPSFYTCPLVRSLQMQRFFKVVKSDPRRTHHLTHGWIVTRPYFEFEWSRISVPFVLNRKNALTMYKRSCIILTCIHSYEYLQRHFEKTQKNSYTACWHFFSFLTNLRYKIVLCYTNMILSLMH
jgi:hypothetical protein